MVLGLIMWSHNPSDTGVKYWTIGRALIITIAQKQWNWFVNQCNSDEIETEARLPSQMAGNGFRLNLKSREVLVVPPQIFIHQSVSMNSKQFALLFQNLTASLNANSNSSWNWWKQVTSSIQHGRRFTHSIPILIIQPYSPWWILNPRWYPNTKSSATQSSSQAEGLPPGLIAVHSWHSWDPRASWFLP